MGLASTQSAQLDSDKNGFKILPGETLHYCIVWGLVEGECTRTPMIAEKEVVADRLDILGAGEVPAVYAKSQ